MKKFNGFKAIHGGIEVQLTPHWKSGFHVTVFILNSVVFFVCLLFFIMITFSGENSNISTLSFGFEFTWVFLISTFLEIGLIAERVYGYIYHTTKIRLLSPIHGKNARYEVLKGIAIMEEGALTPNTFILTNQSYTIRTKTATRCLVLFLKTRYLDQKTYTRLPEGEGYVLLRKDEAFTDHTLLIVDQLCDLLQVTPSDTLKITVDT